MQNETLPTIDQKKVNEWARGEDVMCLHAICQPLVSEMQTAIRQQRQQLDRCDAALNYLFKRIRTDDKVCNIFHATESFARLTAIAAEISGVDVDALRNSIIPGCADLHSDKEES